MGKTATRGIVLSRGAFCFDFDPSKPLGYSFATAHIAEGRTACKVVSVADSADPNQRLHINTDTLVQAIEILRRDNDTGERDLKHVQSHRDLKLLFYEAGNRSSRIRVWFVKVSSPVTHVEGSWDGGTSWYERRKAAAIRPKMSPSRPQQPQMTVIGPKAPPSCPTHGGQVAGEDSKENQMSQARRQSHATLKRVTFDKNVVFIEPRSHVLSLKRESDVGGELLVPAKRQRIDGPDSKATCGKDTLAVDLDPQKRDPTEEESHQWLFLYLASVENRANEWKRFV